MPPALSAGEKSIEASLASHDNVIEVYYLVTMLIMSHPAVLRGYHVGIIPCTRVRREAKRVSAAPVELYIATGAARLINVLIVDMVRTYVSTPQPTESLTHDRERKGQTQEVGSCGLCTFMNTWSTSITRVCVHTYLMNPCTTIQHVGRDGNRARSDVAERQTKIRSEEE